MAACLCAVAFRYCFRVCAVSTAGAGNFTTQCEQTQPATAPLTVLGVAPRNTSTSFIDIGNGNPPRRDSCRKSSSCVKLAHTHTHTHPSHSLSHKHTHSFTSESEWGTLRCEGSPCDSVEAEATPSTSSTWLAHDSASIGTTVVNASCNATHLRIPALAPATNFTVRLRAHNAVGFGPYSAPLLLRTNAASAQPPLACAPPAFTAVAADAITVTWTHACRTRGAQLLAVDVQLANTSGPFVTIASTFLRVSQRETSLLAMQRYCARTRPITALGTGPWSNVSCVTTRRGGEPSAPSIHPAPVHADGTRCAMHAAYSNKHTLSLACTDTPAHPTHPTYRLLSKSPARLPANPCSTVCVRVCVCVVVPGFVVVVVVAVVAAVAVVVGSLDLWDSLSIKWNLPRDGGHPITHFQVTSCCSSLSLQLISLFVFSSVRGGKLTHSFTHAHTHTHSHTHSFTLPHSLTHPSFPTCSWVLFVLCLQVQQDNWWIDQPLTTVANTTALTFTTQFPLFPSASYSFRVCACNDIGCGVRIPFALVLLPLASIPFRAICDCTFSVMAAKFPCSSSPLPHASMLLLLSFFWFVLFCFWLMS